MNTLTPVYHTVPNISKKVLILEIILEFSTSTLCCLLLWKEHAFSAGLNEWDEWMRKNKKAPPLSMVLRDCCHLDGPSVLFHQYAPIRAAQFFCYLVEMT